MTEYNNMSYFHSRHPDPQVALTLALNATTTAAAALGVPCPPIVELYGQTTTPAATDGTSIGYHRDNVLTLWSHLAGNARLMWTLFVCIAGHELAHIYNRDAERLHVHSHLRELQADYASGVAAAKAGIQAHEAQWVCSVMATLPESDTHPAGHVRAQVLWEAYTQTLAG
jgi:hypothetical protein